MRGEHPEGVKIVSSGKLATRTTMKGIINQIIPMYSLTIRRMEMRNIVYGISIHVCFVDYITIVLPNVGRESPCTGRSCLPGRRQDVKTTLQD
jgi:hypothetical protein